MAIPSHCYLPVKPEPCLETSAVVKQGPDASLAGQKRKYPFGQAVFSDAEEAYITEQLQYGLSKRETSNRPGPGGIKITYLEGWRATDIANRIFGFNGWKSEGWFSSLSP